MPGMTSLSIAVSGLRAAQAGLYVTGHNLANVSTIGYTRQQHTQNDFAVTNVGQNGWGRLQLGLGTDVAQIRQLRDKYLDVSYREAVGKAEFYNIKYTVGSEIEAIIGEMEGQYKLQSVLSDLWDALNELSVDPKSVETRGNFIATCGTFLEKVNDTYNNLYNYQQTLNEQVKKQVQRANQLINEIDKYNQFIFSAEAAGDNANDYRDMRNSCLDELSGILNITYKERSNGKVDVLCEGKELLVGGNKVHIGLRYTGPNTNFVEPVITDSLEILKFDPQFQNAESLFNFSAPITPDSGNDSGSLKGLLVARGLYTSNYSSFKTADPDGVDLASLMPGTFLYTVPEEDAGTKLTDDYKKAMEQFLLDLDSYMTGVAAYTGTGPRPQPPSPPSYLKNQGEVSEEYKTAMKQYNAKLSEYIEKAEKFMDTAEDVYDYNQDPVMYWREYFNASYCTIPKVQMELDNLVHSIVTMINNIVSPVTNGEKDSYNSPYDLHKNKSFEEIFVRAASDYSERFDSNGNYVAEDRNNRYSQYTIGNLILNPDLLNPSGYDKISLSISGDESDSRLLLSMLEKFKQGFVSFNGGEKLSIDAYYRKFISEIAIDTGEAKSYVKAQTDLLTQIDYDKSAMSGVSLDEEMKSMLVYQHAYNAAARVLNVIDSMLDKVINSTGRVGL